MKKLAQQIRKQVHPLFIGKEDIEVHGVPDHWRSYADEVERGEFFEDDCDAYAMTCAELLVRQGADPEKVRIAIGRIRDEGLHMVCIYGKWAIDNLRKGIVAWSNLPYEWISSMRMNEPGVWREAKT